MSIDENWIRPAAVAGAWYPDDPEALARLIDGYLDEHKPVDGTPLALIVPHAGYQFSGSVAAQGFRQLQGAEVDTVVVIGSDHQPPVSRPISVWAKGGFETPLGVLPVNEELANSIVANDARIRFDPTTHTGEHAVEIELPFLKTVHPDCRIVPILIGQKDAESVRVLAEALLELLPEEGVVIVASSDLSHYPSYEQAIEVDSATLGAIELGDPEGLRRAIEEQMEKGIHNLATCACGEAPIRVAMQVAAERGAADVSRLEYSNSGDLKNGDRRRVVGYGAVMFWEYEAPEFDRGQRVELIQLAREAIEAHLRQGMAPKRPIADPELQRRSAVFVTLRQGEEMRGCIGQVRADTPLYQAVRSKAVAAATGDPRFPPLTENDLGDLTYEISILSPLQRVAALEQIEVGKHGVAVRHDRKKGVLLPKVAADRDWDRDQLLSHLFAKADLPERGWEVPALRNRSGQALRRRSGQALRRRSGQALRNRSGQAGLYRFTTVEVTSD